MALFSKRILKRALSALALIGLVVGYLSIHFRLTPVALTSHLIRFGAAYVFEHIYSEDKTLADNLIKSYYINRDPGKNPDPETSWNELQKSSQGLRLLSYKQPDKIANNEPFLYGKTDTDEIKNLRRTYDLDKIISKGSDEFNKMVLLAAWVGTRWDHGTSQLPESGKPKDFDPVATIKAGENGARYWCNIASQVAIFSAVSLGWPARLVTLSRDGYTWEHAVAEFWSNQYAKWFVVDCDFNYIYTSNGIPLSAFELCHQGLQLQKEGRLEVHQFAPMKPSLSHLDLLPYYAYVSIDLRSNWLSMELRHGSPVGGSLATYWTSRPSLNQTLTAAKRVDNEKVFNWPVNITEVYGLTLQRLDRNYELKVRLAGYSPYFQSWSISMDNDDWHEVGNDYTFSSLAQGTHELRSRMKLFNNNYGPISAVIIHLE